MTASTYSIQEFAALAGVTVKALHHYDRIGLPLRRIRALLSPGAPPLHATLRQQRHVLEDRRRLLDRAIRALEAAEAGLESSPDGGAALQSLIEVMGMQDSVDEMRRYYSDEVWDAWRHHYDAWPSVEWRDLYRDVNALLDVDPQPDPLGADAQALGARWLALDKAETTNGAVRTGLRKAWADREHWPEAMRARLAELRVDRATRFVNAVLWERWEAERLERERNGHAAPARVSDARIDLVSRLRGRRLGRPGRRHGAAPRRPVAGHPPRRVRRRRRNGGPAGGRVAQPSHLDTRDAALYLVVLRHGRGLVAARRRLPRSRVRPLAPPTATGSAGDFTHSPARSSGGQPGRSPETLPAERFARAGRLAVRLLLQLRRIC